MLTDAEPTSEPVELAEAEERLYSLAEVEAFEREGVSYELLHGRLIKTMPASKRHGNVAIKISIALGSHIEKNKLGECYAAETGFVLSKADKNMIAPDFAFIRADREQFQAAGWSDVIPDFVLEVISPNEIAEDVHEKVLAWLKASVRLVWLAYPNSKTVAAYLPTGDAKIYQAADLITCHDVIAGFEQPVSSFF